MANTPLTAYSPLQALKILVQKVDVSENTSFYLIENQSCLIFEANCGVAVPLPCLLL